MAQENKVKLYGQVMNDTTTKNRPGTNEPYRSTFAIKVLRRPKSQTQIMDNRLDYSYPLVSSRNEDMMAQMKNLKEGDMVELKGVLTTAEVKKITICPKCKSKNSIPGNYVYITPIHIRLMEQGLSSDDGNMRLKEDAEVSNEIIVIGTLCRDPEHYVDEYGRHSAQYQLAVGRKYRIKEDNENIRTDYPWVKTYGDQAYKDSLGLHTGSVIEIDGSIKTRDVVRKHICTSCGHMYGRKEVVTEIIPYSIEYLENCEYPEPEDNEDGETGE